MSLGDMSKRVNIAGQNTFTSAHGRLMKEKAEHEKQLEMREADQRNREVLRQKTEHSRVQREIDRARRDLNKFRSGPQNAVNNALLRRTESQVKALEGQAKMIEENIRSNNSHISGHGGISF